MKKKKIHVNFCWFIDFLTKHPFQSAAPSWIHRESKIIFNIGTINYVCVSASYCHYFVHTTHYHAYGCTQWICILFFFLSFFQIWSNYILYGNIFAIQKHQIVLKLRSNLLSNKLNSQTKQKSNVQLYKRIRTNFNVKLDTHANL